MNRDNYTILQLKGDDSDMVRMVRQYDPFARVWGVVDAQRTIKNPRIFRHVVFNYAV